MRDGGGLTTLVTCIDSPLAETQQNAMALLGNLLTDVFDYYAVKTLGGFVSAGGLMALQRQLSAPYPVNVFACATLQNVTSLDPMDCCTQLREQGCGKELSKLLGSGDETLVGYATAVLANLRAYDPSPEVDDALEESIRMRRLAAIVEQMRHGKAFLVQGAAHRWARKRACYGWKYLTDLASQAFVLGGMGMLRMSWHCLQLTA